MYIYSRTWGKYPEVFHVKNSRSSNTGETYFTQNEYYQESIYPEGTQVSRYPSGTQVSRYPSGPSTSEGYEANSFYARIAQGNPYEVGESSRAASAYPYPYPTDQDQQAKAKAVPQNMAMDDFCNYVDEESKQIKYDYSNYSAYPYPTGQDQQAKATENNNSYNRFFVVDSINENGTNRSLYTPSPYTVDSSQLLRAPKLGNLDTPSTMTPLFGSKEQLSPKPSQSSIAYTNDTNHASIGCNESSYECTEPVNVNFKRERDNIEPRSGQFKKERSIAETKIRERIRDQFQDPRWGQSAFVDVVSQPTFKNEDAILYDNPKEGKAKLVAKINNFTDKVETLTVKYRDQAKCKFYWKIWEQGTGNYSTYEEFQLNFDPHTKIWREIAKVTKSDISSKVKSIMHTNPFGYKGKAIEVQDIRRLPPSSAEARINDIHSRRNRAIPYRSEKKNK